MLKEFGTPLEVQKEMMRHASITTTLEYGKITPQSVRVLRETSNRVAEVLSIAAGGRR